MEVPTGAILQKMKERVSGSQEFLNGSGLTRSQDAAIDQEMMKIRRYVAL
jgi:hypothetical protein